MKRDPEASVMPVGSALRDELEEWPAVQRCVPALGQPLPVVACPRSVFEIASSKVPKGGLAKLRRPSAATPEPLRPQRVVTPGFSVTQCEGTRYPDARWTPEKAELERIRRAKQRPPRPPKGYRTRGKKVRKWDGDGFDE